MAVVNGGLASLVRVKGQHTGVEEAAFKIRQETVLDHIVGSAHIDGLNLILVQTRSIMISPL